MNRQLQLPRRLLPLQLAAPPLRAATVAPVARRERQAGVCVFFRSAPLALAATSRCSAASTAPAIAAASPHDASARFPGVTQHRREPIAVVGLSASAHKPPPD